MHRKLRKQKLRKTFTNKLSSVYIHLSHSTSSTILKCPPKIKSEQSGGYVWNLANQSVRFHEAIIVQTDTKWKGGYNGCYL